MALTAMAGGFDAALRIGERDIDPDDRELLLAQQREATRLQDVHFFDLWG